MNESATTIRPVVVGIDGSKAAMRAARWAVDDAMSHGVPLHLLYAIEQGDTQQPDAMARNTTTAETAVRQAFTAIEAMGQPVKIETEIVEGPAVSSLTRASATAGMVCVGAVGLRHFQAGRVGSTAAALAISARCPVAIIRGHDNHFRHPAREIVVEVCGSPDTGELLSAAIGEARVRNAALRVIMCRRIAPGGDHSARGGDREALADLDRRLARWRRRCPHLRLESSVVHGGLVEYLADNRRSVQLVIVGPHNRQNLSELVGPVGSARLQDADCSLLIVNRQHL